MPDPAPNITVPPRFPALSATEGVFTPAANTFYDGQNTLANELSPWATWAIGLGTEVHDHAVAVETARGEVRDHAIAVETARGEAEASRDLAQTYAAAAGSAAGLPALAGNAGKALAVNQAEDAVEFVDIAANLATPTNVSPTSGAVDQGASPTLTGSEYGSLYGLTMAAGQWQVSTASDFATTVVDTGDVVGTSVSFSVPTNTLAISTTYFWRVRYKDSAGEYSEWSAPTSFTTAASFFPSSEVAKLLASDGAAGDSFGFVVAISGDYAVVPALYNDGVGADSGSVYVFFRDAGIWTQQAKLVASDAAGGDYFGRSAAISGDYIVVGASGNDDSGSNSGSAYVYHRTGTSWVQQAKLVASDAVVYDQFGEAVDIDGDYIVVGAKDNDDSGSNSGSAYVYHRTGTSWVQQAKLVASDAVAYDQFGAAVDIDGDYIVVGASGNDDSGSNSGSAYVYHRTGTSWVQQAKLVASDAVATDQFGAAVDIDGDYIVVGARNNDDAGSNSGSAYVFHRTGTSWAQQAKLVASDAVATDTFGAAVAIDDDYIVVGASYADIGGNENAGAVYLYSRTGTSWAEEVKIVASDGAASDLLGGGVSIDAGRIVAGAYTADALGNSSGAAYIFE